MVRGSEASSCRQHTLARSGTAHVQRCEDCGTLSVHMGAVTLRFAPQALEALWSTLGEALIVLHQEAQTEPSVLTTLRARGEA